MYVNNFENLAEVDRNCNDCYFFIRDLKKLKQKQENDKIAFEQSKRKKLDALYEDLEEIQLKEKLDAVDHGTIGHLKKQIKLLEKRNFQKDTDKAYGFCANENEATFMKELTVYPIDSMGKNCFAYRNFYRDHFKKIASSQTK